MAEVYKLHTARRNGGHVRFFENRGAFELELLAAELEVEYRKAQGRFMSALRWAIAVVRRKDTDDFRTERDFKAQQFVNGEWVDLKYEVILPDIRIKEPGPYSAVQLTTEQLQEPLC